MTDIGLPRAVSRLPASIVIYSASCGNGRGQGVVAMIPPVLPTRPPQFGAAYLASTLARARPFNGRVHARPGFRLMCKVDFRGRFQV